MLKHQAKEILPIALYREISCRISNGADLLFLHILESLAADVLGPSKLLYHGYLPQFDVFLVALISDEQQHVVLRMDEYATNTGVLTFF